MGSGSIHPTPYRFCWDATEKATDSSTRWIGDSLRTKTDPFHSSFGCPMGDMCPIRRLAFQELFNG
jgi:hypothetical protein